MPSTSFWQDPSAMPSTSFWQDLQLLILLRQGWSSSLDATSKICSLRYSLINASFCTCLLALSENACFRFHYMAITDEKQGIMLMPEDLLPDRGKQLIVPESILLVNPINPDLER